MLLDTLIMENLGNIGQVFLKKSQLNKIPQNINEMYTFLNSIKNGIENNDPEGIILGNILFSFVSSEKIRTRKVTSRTFEDIFSGLFNEKCTDSSARVNPQSTDELKTLDALCIDEDWNISTDLSGNKREKADFKLPNYDISLKTLKGKSYNENDKIIDTDFNDELNLGSFSTRALLKNIINENLSDRKGGLGSSSQLLKNVINPIQKHNLMETFKSRLKLFLDYVYTEDIYIVLKSNYRIEFYLIPAQSFVNCLINALNSDPVFFTKIFYRWEGNNLRVKWIKLLDAMSKFNLPYYTVSIHLNSSISNSSFKNFMNDLNNQIENYIGLSN